MAAKTKPSFKAALARHKHPVQLPFHLSAPEDVFLLIHEDGEMLVFALLYGV